MSGEARRAIVWAAAGLVVLGVAVGAFSVGRSFASPMASAVADNVAVDDVGMEVSEALPDEEPNDAPARGEATTQAVAGTVVVYISGAVAQPDTYVLPADARVKDVVLAAGGLSADAATDSINLAERIADTQHIHVPRVGDVAASQTADVVTPENGTPGLVNVNSASAAELEELPRIGAALAERIVEWRGANGPFQSLDDVQKVKGVSASVFDEIKALISVE